MERRRARPTKRSAAGVATVCKDFRVQAVTVGKDAQAEVNVELEYLGRIHRGRGDAVLAPLVPRRRVPDRGPVPERPVLVVDGPERAASRAMLHAVGFTRDDFKRSQVGVASTWSMVTPCNMHIDQLAVSVAQGVNEAGGKAVVFNTITVSD